jgi:hypothetical protein
MSVVAVTRKEPLEAMLPPGFDLWGEPTIFVEMKYLTEIEWLAGRGYNILGVRTPVIYKGKNKTVKGFFQLIYWENLTDPILTGRDEVGAPKIYAELPDARVFGGKHICNAGWFGHEFFEMSVGDLVTEPVSQAGDGAAYADSQGLMWYKYFPKTGARGEADACYVTLSPAGKSLSKTTARMAGTGSFEFRRSSFEQLPTMYHIVNAFAGLEILKVTGASVNWSQGGRDFADTVILD